ncbi:MAG: nucleotide-binding universal stress UspA family protein [Kiritimatiellia bacterium]|jgi:nucleotide-binding universal stress UspA family protein
MLHYPPRTVLVPIDFSDLSFEALDTALRMVGTPERLHLVHVTPPIIPPGPGVAWSTVDDQTRVAHIAEAMHKELDDRGMQAAGVHVVVGAPAYEIAKKAAMLKVDLVVLSSHGRTGFSRFALGSVAERLVRLCTCPVLVLKQDFGG